MVTDDGRVLIGIARSIPCRVEAHRRFESITSSRCLGIRYTEKLILIVVGIELPRIGAVQCGSRWQMMYRLCLCN